MYIDLCSSLKMASPVPARFEPVLSFPKRLEQVHSKVFRPFVCMNNSGDVVVLYEIKSAVIDQILYYVVGRAIDKREIKSSSEQEEPSLTARGSFTEYEKVDLESEGDRSEYKAKGKGKPPMHQEIKWSNEQGYGSGCNAQAAINDNGLVVLVCELKGRKCVYSVGKVTKNMQIEWVQKDQDLCKGVKPCVAMTGSNVVFFHEADNIFHKHLLWKLGKLDENSCNIEVDSKKSEHLSELDGYEELSLAITQEHIVIVSCSKIVFRKFVPVRGLFYAIGKLEKNSLFDFKILGQYGTGCHPQISLLNNKFVVEVHESHVGFQLWNQVGRLIQSQKLVLTDQSPINNYSIEWFESQKYDTGYRPSVAVNDNYHIVEVHTAFRDVPSPLWHRCGHLQGSMS